jgi:hypothetical protein
MSQEEIKVHYTVLEREARVILRDVYQIHPGTPVNQKRFTPIELEEIDQLLSIINKN